MAALAIDLLYHRKKIMNVKTLKNLKHSGKKLNMKMNTRSELKDVCRLCSRKAKIPIFTDSTVNKAENIRIVTSIEVTEGDELPQKLCVECNRFLNDVSIFKKQALATDARLKKKIKLLKKNKAKSNIKSTRITPTRDQDYVRKMSSSALDYLNKAKEEPDDHTYEICIENDVPIDDDDDDDDEVVEHPCEKCPLKFTCLNDFILHRRTAHELWKVPCPECNNLFQKSYLEKHIASVHRKERPYVCEICGIGYPFKVSLQTHQQTHNNEFAFRCAHCPYRARIKSSLRVHMKLHSGIKPFSCEVCGARFVCRANQKRHSYVHTRAFKFKCEKCGKGFQMMCLLKQHTEAIHEGRKDHECDICNKRFGFRKRMMYHRRKVHKVPPMPSGRTPKYLLAEQIQQDDIK